MFSCVEKNKQTNSVTSGTGVIGYRVAVSLLAAGQDVRVGVWKGDRQGMDSSFGQVIADALQAKGAEVMEFDWSNEEGKLTHEKNFTVWTWTNGRNSSLKPLI